MGTRVLLIINRMTYGGAGKMMAFLANGLSLEGCDVNLLTYEDNEVVPFLTPRVQHVNFRYSPPAITGLRRILQILHVRKAINEINPDIVISFLTYPNMISILALIGRQTPIIISERGDPFSEKGWFSLLRDFAYNFAEGYVFQTSAAKGYYSKRIQAKAVVIPNPVIAEETIIDTDRIQEDIIVNMGRLELKQKRQDVLIRAFSKIAGKFPNMRLVIYGDGEDESQISRIIADCRLEDRVVLAGVTKNVYESIRSARMFVLSSDYEGIPNALIEAMYSGLPCVSTDCSPGGAAELIKNMENGILVKAGCVDELANAMEFMLKNPRKAAKMGENARNIVRDLDPDVIIHQWKGYIASCISANR